MSRAQAQPEHQVGLVRLAVLCLCAALAACGYQLRGTQNQNVAFERVEVACNFKQSWYLCQQLESRLALAGVELNENAALRLRITTPSSKQRVLTIAGDASTEEYELTQRLAYVLERKSDRKILARNELSLARVYSHQSNALVAKEREKESLLRSMHRQILNTMLRELAELQLNPSES
ncbi:MAG: hypothetical protein R3183_10380 [Oleiphilaceae bacterium]|nr:hypothetical protein [Oleiphilaceae bacterium]